MPKSRSEEITKSQNISTRISGGRGGGRGNKITESQRIIAPGVTHRDQAVFVKRQTIINNNNYLLNVPYPLTDGSINEVTRTISGTDSDYVDLIDLTVPHAVFGGIYVLRNANATAGQVVSYRVYVDDVLVDERSITWPSDGANTRVAKLLLRAPGSVTVANSTQTKVGGDTFTAGTYARRDLADQLLGHHNAFSFAPKKLKVQMKGTTITVSNTFRTRVYSYQCAIGGTYWSDLVNSTRGDRSRVGTIAADGAFTDLISVSGPGQLMSPAFIRQTVNSGTIAAADYRILVDGFVIKTVTTAPGSATQWVVLSPEVFANPFIDATDPSPLYRDNDRFPSWPGPRFASSMKVQHKAGANGSTQTTSVRAEVAWSPLIEVGI